MKVTAEWLTSRRVQAIFQLVSGAGHQIHAVGGCVRNALLNLPAKDIDFATDATPDQLLKLAEAHGVKAVPTGIEHGTITLIQSGTGFEVTTFRRDVKTDGRHADVVFATSIEADAQRRDFTMNALYCDRDGQLLDPVGGLDDLLARRVVFVGDPAERITEDYLRILRFFRFHAWYGDAEQGIDAEGLAACAALAEGLDLLSAERIGAETTLLLAAVNPAPSVAAMAQTGILARLLFGHFVCS